MSPLPLIKIEVESMRVAMHHAFSEQMLSIDKMFKEAIDAACDPEKVRQHLTEAAKTYLHQAIEEETKSYFLYGDGRRAVREEVAKKLATGQE